MKTKVGRAVVAANFPVDKLLPIAETRCCKKVNEPSSKIDFTLLLGLAECVDVFCGNDSATTPLGLVCRGKSNEGGGRQHTDVRRAITTTH